MKRQPLTDGSGRWFDKDNAEKHEEDTRWDGSNHISVATGSQWCHETVWKTASGKYIMHQWSNYQGSMDTWEEISDDEAHRWLASNGHFDAIPDPSTLEM